MGLPINHNNNHSCNNLANRHKIDIGDCLMKIITNNHPRDVLNAWDFNGEEFENIKKEFDYIDWSDVEAGTYSVHFIKYNGQYLDLSEFEPIDTTFTTPNFRKWDCYQSDTFFSGTLIKWVPNTDMEQVIVGRYYA